MLFANPLEQILGQVSKVRILRFLVLTDQELNGREIAAAIGLSHVKAHTALKELNKHDIVEMRHVGKSILYRLNLKNVLVKKMLIPLFKSEARLRDVIAETMSRYLKDPAPDSIILFGSIASGKARPDSDIDVLIISSHKKDIPAIEESLHKAEISMTTCFGNHLAPILMDETEFRKQFKSRNKVIRSIVRNGKVIFGKSINELIKSND